MDTLLQNGDHGTGPQGIPLQVDGMAEIIQRALIRLSVRKGSFPYDPNLGSELYRLTGVDERTAQSYVQEALLPLPGVGVEEVRCLSREAGTMQLAVTLTLEGSRYELMLIQNL